MDTKTVEHGSTKLVDRYSQTMHVKQYETEFNWTLHNWTLLKDLLHSAEIIESKAFLLKGTLSCQCRLFLTESRFGPSLKLEFQNATHVSLFMITIDINCWNTSNHKLYQPIPSVNKLELEVLLRDRLKLPRGKESGSKEKETDSDILTITAKLVVLQCSSCLPSVSTNSVTNVSEKIRSMYTDKILCDVTFLIGEKELVAHRNILAAHSKVFEAMFLVEMAEKNEGRVKIVDISAKIFEKFLNYLYFGEVDNLHEIVEEMVGVADKYQVAELKTLCQNYMVQNLSSENAFKYIDIAEKFCCAELKTEALNFLRNDDGILATVFKKENLEEITILKKMLSDSSQN